MTSPRPGESLDSLVETTRKALAGQLPDAPEPSDTPAVYLGQAADGLVTAEVSSTGTVRRLDIEPVMLSRPLADVADAARLAINAALDSRPGVTDYSAVITEVRSMQAQARRDLTAITQGMAEVAQHIRAAGPRPDTPRGE